MHTYFRFIWILAILSLIAFILYWCQPNSDALQWLTQIYIIPPLITSCSAIYFVKKHFISIGQNPLTMYMLLTAIGFMCWVIGGFIWLGLEILNYQPYPSPADFFYIVSSPLIFFGIIFLYRRIADDILVDLHKISSLIILLLINSFVFILNFNPIENFLNPDSNFNKSDLITYFTNLFYTVADCFALGFTSALFLSEHWKKIERSAKLSIVSLNLGMIFFYLANLFFSIQNSKPIMEVFPYKDGSYVDFSYAISMILFSFSTLFALKSLKSLIGKDQEKESRINKLIING